MLNDPEFWMFSLVRDGNALSGGKSHLMDHYCPVCVFDKQVLGVQSEAKDRWKHELLCFTGARIATLIMEVLLMALFIEMLLWNEMFAKIIVQIVVVIMNYILSKYLVFRKGGE